MHGMDKGSITGRSATLNIEMHQRNMQCAIAEGRGELRRRSKRLHCALNLQARQAAPQGAQSNRRSVFIGAAVQAVQHQGVQVRQAGQELHIIQSQLGSARGLVSGQGRWVQEEG